MRPEDFHDRPTVNPTTKRLYAYGQMLFGAVTAAATIIAAVYAFLGNYTTDAELRRAFDANNLDMVEAGKTLPHNMRFVRVEDEIKSLRANIDNHNNLLAKLSETDLFTLEVLAGCIATEKPLYAHPAVTCNNYHYFLSIGQLPLNAFRLALTTPSKPVHGRP
jgi:hypothetical protein